MRVGELLAREVAAVAMIEERRATSHCWYFLRRLCCKSQNVPPPIASMFEKLFSFRYCLLPCAAPLPCPGCSAVVFCSSVCADTRILLLICADTRIILLICADSGILLLIFGTLVIFFQNRSARQLLRLFMVLSVGSPRCSTR